MISPLVIPVPTFLARRKSISREQEAPFSLWGRKRTGKKYGIRDDDDYDDGNRGGEGRRKEEEEGAVPTTVRLPRLYSGNLRFIEKDGGLLHKDSWQRGFLRGSGSHYDRER